MPIFSLKSQAKSICLHNPDADYRSAKRAEQYRVSKQAIYFPAFPGTRYLPFAAVTRAQSKSTSMTVKGCCGKELPIVRLRIFYDAESGVSGTEFYQDFTFEHLAGANRVLDALQMARPDIFIQRETTEHRVI